MLELARGLQKGDQLEVTIDSITDQGLGRGEVQALVGPQREETTYALHVRKAVPGDRVIAVVERRRRRRCTCHILEIKESSRIRTTPRCPHFGRREIAGQGCGGCTYQSLRYRHQLAIKERNIKDHFMAQNLDPGLVLPLKGMDDPWFYRNKMVYSFGDTKDREFALGLHPTGYSYEIVNLETCYLQSPFAAQFVVAARQWAVDHGLKPWRNSTESGFLFELMIREGKQTEQRLVELVTSPQQSVEFDGESQAPDVVARHFADFCQTQATALGEPITSVYWTQKIRQKGQPTRHVEHLLQGQPMLHERLDLPGQRSLRFAIHPRAFFQTNTLGAQSLYSEVIERADLGSTTDTVLDLYSGTGTIGLAMAPYCDNVFGIEREPEAVKNARKNADHNDIENVEFFVGDVGEVLKSEKFQAIHDQIDLTIVDPPRAGLRGDSVDQIVAIAAPRLVYVSCNPASLARDLVALAKGGYELQVVQPLDLFPQTYHVESVALLNYRK